MRVSGINNYNNDALAADSLGLDAIESYAKKLLDLVERRPREGPCRCWRWLRLVRLEVLWRHNYVTVSLLWNLRKEAFEELAEQLNPPSESVLEEVWNYVGGNPRTLIEVATSYRWDVRAWFSRVVERAETVYRRMRLGNLVNYLKQVAEDPDYLYVELSPKQRGPTTSS